MQIDWKKIEFEYGLQNPPDFRTHLNYVSCMKALSKGIGLLCNSSIKNKINESKTLKKKINLSKLTLNSIKGEYKTIQKNPDYAELCVSWISVKSYYLLFNLLLILDYLIAAHESVFQSSHKESLKRFKDYIENNNISFSEKLFNNNFPCSKIMNLHPKSGANIKIIDIDMEERVAQILKKLVRYKLEDIQREEKIKNFRSKKNRKIRDDFLTKNTVNIFEFFYWYRIKANYRDLEFLNKDISSKQFEEFYRNYFELTLYFFEALKKIINDLSKIRLGKIIL
ncbi:MAG: hypothetical protein A2W05_10385 [Candidatus Schekmanbacteria bacterium RBG_16_38_10]|uniref:Uncharacterized protein n=1 Tax=Candidatus Schekmanbacteria bacterium RBG_16_38_10 TaxID=1817879 RepID=A0A1F7S0W2_9BACT|nr:MAG: hypothetical protein A2W05_10385 [Candidatus Schekmanbacteria bacterium RBG_16_38_10]